MKNVNGIELVGKKMVNSKNGITGIVIRLNENNKYSLAINNEEKEYSLSTLKRNWKIVEDIDTEQKNIEEFMKEVVLTLPLALPSSDEIETDEIKEEDEIMEEAEEVISGTEETEEFVLETENEGIIDNIKETEGKVKITGHLYGVPVKFDKINQTTIWKTLIKLYDNRKDENDKYSLEDKKYLVRQLKQLDEKVFAGAFRCLVSKTKQNYIEELMKEKYTEEIKFSSFLMHHF